VRSRGSVAPEETPYPGRPHIERRRLLVAAFFVESLDEALGVVMSSVVPVVDLSLHFFHFRLSAFSRAVFRSRSPNLPPLSRTPPDVGRVVRSFVVSRLCLTRCSAKWSKNERNFYGRYTS
jgi:hypothetical protein